MTKLKLAAAVLAAGTLLGACSGTGQEESGASTETGDLTYAVITHAAAGDTFWDRVKSGAERAGDDYGVSVDYSSSNDPAEQSQLIDNAVAKDVDGIVVSMANPEGLESSIKKAVAAGVPVVTINSGQESSKAFGAITHIGQSETIAGTETGEQLKAAGWKNALCVIHEAGNVGHEARCKAAAEALGAKMTNLQVDGTNDAEVKATIKAKLQSDKTIDGVLTLSGQYGIDAVGAVDEAGSQAQVATFDITEDVITAIEDGTILFAVDQQPYVQGYLGVTTLYLKDINGNDVGGGQPVNSGPAFVTKENVAQVAEFAKNGTR
ncbi:sugar ABC transporter substrate-binding protein [Aeromicrobium massiliense]|uniref:sugar ABC transporter substrate-binding protein n=1 Tax=Aeromicrobium massiliense TaxID=1464554 RepID=UPI0002DA16D2|nr:sugar ABC transporter substrate-binding protein [Aeromicrobium massiliense]